MSEAKYAVQAKAKVALYLCKPMVGNGPAFGSPSAAIPFATVREADDALAEASKHTRFELSVAPYPEVKEPTETICLDGPPVRPRKVAKPHQLVREGRRLVVLVCGARDWTQRSVIREWLAKLPAGSIVVHGGCGKRDERGVAIEGADLIADDVARELGLEVRAYPVDHALDGPWPGAGPRRNQRQLDAEHPDVGLAFTYALRRQDRTNHPTGTGDMVLRAVEAGVRVTIVPPKRLEVRSLMQKPGEP